MQFKIDVQEQSLIACIPGQYQTDTVAHIARLWLAWLAFGLLAAIACILVVHTAW